MRVSQCDLEAAYFQQEMAHEIAVKACQGGQERGRFLAMSGCILDLDFVCARLRDYEERPFLRVYDEIRFARIACLYLLRMCFKEALKHSQIRRMLKAATCSLHVRWLAFAANIQVACEAMSVCRFRGYRADLADTLTRLKHANC
jgi:hypothetical protein